MMFVKLIEKCNIHTHLLTKAIWKAMRLKNKKMAQATGDSLLFSLPEELGCLILVYYKLKIRGQDEVRNAWK